MKKLILLSLVSVVLSRSISLTQVVDFLIQDQTNLNQYNKYDYVCADFAADLVHNAELQGFEARSVTILFTHELGHVIVAFETKDGTIYVEPQTDTIYPLVEVGQPLCNPDWCVGNGEVIRKITEGQ